MNIHPTSSTIEKWNPGLHQSQIDMVAFQLDHQIFTLPIEIIYQIIDMVALTPLPEGNETVEGIFNYHGTTVPVVDLRRYLNLAKIPLHLHTPLILVAYSGQIIGLIVDKVLDVISFPRQAILPPVEMLPENLGEIPILDGVIQSSENFLLMLNLEHLFSRQRQKNFTEALNRLTARPDLRFEVEKPGNGAGTPEDLSNFRQQTIETQNHDKKGNKTIYGNRKERQRATRPQLMQPAAQHDTHLLSHQEERA